MVTIDRETSCHLDVRYLEIISRVSPKYTEHVLHKELLDEVLDQQLFGNQGRWYQAGIFFQENLQHMTGKTRVAADMSDVSESQIEMLK